MTKFSANYIIPNDRKVVHGMCIVRIVNVYSLGDPRSSSSREQNHVMLIISSGVVLAFDQTRYLGDYNSYAITGKINVKPKTVFKPLKKTFITFNLQHLTTTTKDIANYILHL